MSTDATDLIDESVFTAEGSTGSYSAMVHIQVPVNGVLTDYLVMRGVGMEFWQLDPDTGEATLVAEDNSGIQAAQPYTEPSIYEVNGEWYAFTSYRGYDGVTPTSTVDPASNITYKLNQTTGEWEIIQQQTHESLLGSYDNFRQINSDGQTEVFVGADGNTYMWYGNGVASNATYNTFDKLVWDPDTESWGPTGETLDTSSAAAFTNETGIAYPSIANNEMSLVKTPDGYKLIFSGGTGTHPALANKQLTILDLDENGNYTGDYTLYNMNDFADLGDATQLMQNVTVDPNGNIVLFGGSSVSSRYGNGGLIVLDPTGTQVLYTMGDGIGNDSGSTTNLGFIGRDAGFEFKDGYLYISSEAAWNTTAKTYSVILDTSDYSIVSQGFDPDGGRTDFGSSSIEYITTVTGQTFVAEYGVQTNGSSTNILTISPATIGETTVVCFVKGTKIRTVWGEIPIEELIVGDLVETLDHGSQPIRWIGKKEVPGVGALSPILFKPGAIGNKENLLLSPQHRVLVEGWRAELVYGEPRLLVAAKDMVNDHDIIPLRMEWTEYYHILFDRHEIVFAQGVPSESFHPGDFGLATVESKQLKELLKVFPELEDSPKAFGATAYPALNKHEANALLKRVQPLEVMN